MAYTPTTWVDEVLAGAERFDIKDDGGTPIESNVQIVLATGVSVAGTSVDASNLNHIEQGISDLDTAITGLYTAPATSNPSWTGLTGTLNLGNTINYMLVGKLYMITGYFGASGQIVSVLGTTYFTSPVSVYLTGSVEVWINLGASVLPTLVGRGAWHSNRVWMPTFDLTNVYCDLLVMGRVP